MLVVLHDLGLEKYISDNAPELADPNKPTDDEKAAQKAWHEGDAKAQVQIELAIGDTEMIHITTARTACQMWEQLTMVKESKGRLGVLATRWMLYRATA